MFTSESSKSDLRTALIYLIISILLAFAGAVYEHFSFGVYSNYMIYAFAIPLVMGTLTFLLRYIRASGADTRRGADELQGTCVSSADMVWHAAVATLTIGSIMQGALAICGRPNSLTLVYPAAGAALIIAALVLSRAALRQCGNQPD